jgi:hypothetical protein
LKIILNHNIKGGKVDRGKAVGSVIGIALGIATMPILGPFCAFSAMLGAWATKKAFDTLSERTSSSRNANMHNDISERIRKNVGLSEFTNREYTIPSPVDRNIQRSNQNLADILRDLEPPRYNDLPAFHIIRNIELQSELRPRARGQGGKQGIYIDKYGHIYDPQDEDI